MSGTKQVNSKQKYRIKNWKQYNKARRCCTNIPAPSSTSWLPTFYNATDTGIPIADILFSA